MPHLIFTCLSWWRRMLFALTMFCRHRPALKKIYLSKQAQSPSVASIDPSVWYKQGIRLLMIDFDGVLAAHAELRVNAEGATFLNACSLQYGAKNLYLLSNKPSLERSLAFGQDFPDINFVLTQAKKPFPNEILKILTEQQLEASQALIIDDRLATGILAAVISNCRAHWISHPWTNFKKNPFRETFFALLRTIERCCLF